MSNTPDGTPNFNDRTGGLVPQGLLVRGIDALHSVTEPDKRSREEKQSGKRAEKYLKLVARKRIMHVDVSFYFRTIGPNLGPGEYANMCYATVVQCDATKDYYNVIRSLAAMRLRLMPLPSGRRMLPNITMLRRNAMFNVASVNYTRGIRWSD